MYIHVHVYIYMQSLHTCTYMHMYMYIRALLIYKYLYGLNGEVALLITYRGPELYSLQRYLLLISLHCTQRDLQGGREGGREGGSEEGREGGSEGGREGRREEGKEGGREGRREPGRVEGGEERANWKGEGEGSYRHYTTHREECGSHVGLHVLVVEAHDLDQVLQGSHLNVGLVTLRGLAHHLHDEVPLGLRGRKHGHIIVYIIMYMW